MNVEDDIRAREDQIFIAAFERGAAEIGRREMALLQHRAHSSIEHQDTSGKSVFESLAPQLPRVVVGCHEDS